MQGRIPRLRDTYATLHTYTCITPTLPTLFLNHTYASHLYLYRTHHTNASQLYLYHTYASHLYLHHILNAVFESDGGGGAAGARALQL